LLSVALYFCSSKSRVHLWPGRTEKYCCEPALPHNIKKRKFDSLALPMNQNLEWPIGKRFVHSIYIYGRQDDRNSIIIIIIHYHHHHHYHRQQQQATFFSFVGLSEAHFTPRAARKEAKKKTKQQQQQKNHSSFDLFALCCSCREQLFSLLTLSLSLSLSLPH
jgi:hypothetical protein